MKTILHLLFVVGAVSCVTEVFFRNRCDIDIDIYGAEGQNDPQLVVTVPINQRRLVAYETGAVRFQAGFDGITQVDFRFGVNEQTYYAIDLVDGFDSGVSISPYHGTRISCMTSTCQDAIHTTKERKIKTHTMEAAGRVNVTWCGTQRYHRY